ncbi:MAG: leucine-rich repeat domain-containing protein [Promethearchaeota archaeon]|jgi:Leucine-rich repeat (LRR) protein
MPLTPKAIYKDFINGDLDRLFATELLLTLIDNAENIETRIESLNILDKIQIDDEKTFKFLEHLLISDFNEEIRSLTCVVLKNHYLDKCLDSFIWALEHETSLQCLTTIIHAIGESNSKKAKSVISNKIISQKRSFSSNQQDSLPEIKRFTTEVLAEILINYYVIAMLKKSFGYFKFKSDNLGFVLELDLSNVERYSPNLNKLEDFLPSIFSLKSLKTCDLRFNHLTKLPKIIISYLEYLDLSYNKLNRLPELIKFPSIKSLNLKSNILRSLPESIGKLKSLENLNLRNNFLSNLPNSIEMISSLNTLDLHGNKINAISMKLSRSIKELELGWNGLLTIPDSLENLKLLNKLGLGGNKFSILPSWIGIFSLLKVLDLYDNKLLEIPESMGSLKSLEKLNLRNNQLTDLPSSIRNLKSLKSLNLSWNEFKTLPEWIGDLSSLEELNLWGNKLEDLPKSIKTISSLKVIDLNFNRIKDIPSSLRELKRKNNLEIKL